MRGITDPEFQKVGGMNSCYCTINSFYGGMNLGTGWHEFILGWHEFIILKDAYTEKSLMIVTNKLLCLLSILSLLINAMLKI